MVQGTNISQTLRDKFFSDPDWSKVEEVILAYIEPLRDMDTMDDSAPAEHFKAEFIGRKLAYNALKKFLDDSQIVGRKNTSEPRPNNFR